MASNYLKAGQTDAELAKRLVDDSADILALSLDKKVPRLSFFLCILMIIRTAHQ